MMFSKKSRRVDSLDPVDPFEDEKAAERELFDGITEPHLEILTEQYRLALKDVGEHSRNVAQKVNWLAQSHRELERAEKHKEGIESLIEITKKVLACQAK